MLAKSFLPLGLLIMSVLGAIMFGIATPTEAAAVGALGAALFVYVVLVTMLIVYVFPGIAMWLPNALYGR